MLIESASTGRKNCGIFCMWDLLWILAETEEELQEKSAEWQEALEMKDLNGNLCILKDI